MKRDVFISYSRKNMERVKKIKSQIDSQCGTDCWMDVYGGIESGALDYEDAIIEGINKCKVFLFMLSDQSQQSDNARKEFDFAIKKGKKAVLVNINGCELSDKFLFSYGRADIKNWQDSIQRESLLRSIREWINTDLTLKEIEERIARIDKEVGELKRVEWIDWDDNDEGYYFEDANGHIVFDRSIFPYAGEFNEGLAVVMELMYRTDDVKGYIDMSKYGYMDKSGCVVIPYQWEDAEDFSEGFAAVENSDHKWGYIDKSGRVVIPCQWKMAHQFLSNGRAEVEDNNGKKWKIDKTGKVVGEA